MERRWSSRWLVKLSLFLDLDSFTNSRPALADQFPSDHWSLYNVISNVRQSKYLDGDCLDVTLMLSTKTGCLVSLYMWRYVWDDCFCTGKTPWAYLKESGEISPILDTCWPIASLANYSSNWLQRPHKTIVSRDRWSLFNCIEMWDLLPGICGPSRQVVSDAFRFILHARWSRKLALFFTEGGLGANFC